MHGEMRTYIAKIIHSQGAVEDINRRIRELQDRRDRLKKADEIVRKDLYNRWAFDEPRVIIEDRGIAYEVSRGSKHDKVASIQEFLFYPLSAVVKEEGEEDDSSDQTERED